MNYFTETKITARKKVISADIIYFLGGLPDRMYERLVEFDLLDMLLNHRGIVIGNSAGAVIQLAEYHLTPDDDYAEFAYYQGIPYLKDFYVEVHYANTDIQNTSIAKVLEEKKKTVYALHQDVGAIIVENSHIKLLGEVEVFEP